MPTVKRFEDLKIWQLAREQCQIVGQFIEDGRFDFDPPLRDQVNRSSASVMDNIAEGFDRFSRSDFRHFLVMARGSAAEVRSQIYRATDRGYLTADDSTAALDFARDLSVRISNLISHLSHTDYKTKAPSQNPTSLGEPEIAYNADCSYDFLSDHAT